MDGNKYSEKFLCSCTINGTPNMCYVNPHMSRRNKLNLEKKKKGSGGKYTDYYII